MKASWFLLALALTGCGSAAVSVDEPTESTGAAAQPTSTSTPQRAALDVSVVLTAATLADDCGGGSGARPPPVLSKGDMQDIDPKSAKAKRRCEQTSMQLSITSAPGNGPARVLVKKVEVFDSTGKSIGVLSSSDPTVWDESGAYVPWDERVAPSSTIAVSYALAQPVFAEGDGRDQTYTVKALVSVDGVDRSLSQELSTRTTRPPMVKT